MVALSNIGVKDLYNFIFLSLAALVIGVGLYYAAKPRKEHSNFKINALGASFEMFSPNVGVIIVFIGVSLVILEMILINK